jgi:hypothetical protein
LKVLYLGAKLGDDLELFPELLQSKENQRGSAEITRSVLLPAQRYVVGTYLFGLLQ